MINLLPPEYMRQLGAARTNSLLLRYSVLMTLVVAFLALEAVGMYFVVDAGTAQNQATISENAKKTTAFAATKKEAASFTANLSTAKYILGKQVPYTKILLIVAQSMPAGAVVDSISVDPATFGTPASLSVQAKTYNEVIETKTLLQKAQFNEKTPLFTAVSLQSVTTDKTADAHYPIIAQFNVTYSKDILK